MSPRGAKLTAEDQQAVVLPLLDAQTRLVEAIEGGLRCDDHDEVDGLLAEAMRKIATARSANRENQRKRSGLITIAEVG